MWMALQKSNYMESNKKSEQLKNCSLFLAGALGIEPSSGVLETLILPMNYAPINLIILY